MLTSLGMSFRQIYLNKPYSKFIQQLYCYLCNWSDKMMLELNWHIHAVRFKYLSHIKTSFWCRDPQISQQMTDAGKKHLLTVLNYPETGHLIEPPFSPHCSVAKLNKESTFYSVITRKSSPFSSHDTTGVFVVCFFS